MSKYISNKRYRVTMTNKVVVHTNKLPDVYRAFPADTVLTPFYVVEKTLKNTGKAVVRNYDANFRPFACVVDTQFSKEAA